MKEVKLIPTIVVWRVSDGQRCVVNEKDFDRTLYALEPPKTEHDDMPKRGRKAKD